MKDIFGILNDIGENITLVQLVDTVGNENHEGIIIGDSKFYSDYKRHLH